MRTSWHADRETRYAVMALARAYPRPESPLASWVTATKRLLASHGLIRSFTRLDDLENLWDVSDDQRPRYTAEIVRLLDHPSPLVRASAAACLGRLGRSEAAEPLAHKLADPSKIVWRSAAWALRRLGNRGIGVDLIQSAMRDPDVRVRRASTRIFANQFHGMDSRVELADRLIDLTNDSDLWTRLQRFGRFDSGSTEPRIARSRSAL